MKEQKKMIKNENKLKKKFKKILEKTQKKPRYLNYYSKTLTMKK
jgi:hypothetical protein